MTAPDPPDRATRGDPAPLADPAHPTAPAHPANPATALARTVVDELARCGVRHLVLAPGSRSAPLAFAAHDAAAGGVLALHTRVDERSAGFLALGLARASRDPVAVVTTSGTAVANLHPAVLEAGHAGIPLVVLSADRPAALRGTGANQTTDQVKIFSDAVGAFADVPPGAVGDQEPRQVASWRSLVARFAATARGHGAAAAGPVHLNLQLAPPLVPGADAGWGTPTTGRPHGAPWTVLPRPAAPVSAEPETLEPGPRTVVVAGDDAGPPARLLAEAGGWPLLAEPTSGARTGTHVVRGYRLLLEDPALSQRVERVVVCGHPTLSRPVTDLLSRPDVEVVAVAGPTGWTDPGHRVSRVVDAARVATEDAAGQPPVTGWLEQWRERDAEVSRRVDDLLASLTEQGELTGYHVAAEVAAALPAGGLLFVGSSNPVRDLDLVSPGWPVGERRLVVGNRGLAGIDGAVSSAVGAALGRPRSTRALALLGDVTFLHDANGLLLGPREERPDLTLVVANDDGGSVFATLEQGDAAYAGSYDTLFGTPHHADLAALCAVTATPHRRVRTLADLRAALADPGVPGITVVEAVIRRDNRRDLDAALRGLV